MTSVKVVDAGGTEQGTVELDEAIFGITPNLAVMHQVVTAQLAARRSGTQSTKTRAEVRGGGAKPWKQKGTGRARQGSIRSPQWKGGGVALGPKPRSYAQRTPKKMIKLALRSALSDRAADGKVVVIDTWGLDAPSTKAAAAALSALELEGRVVVVVAPDDFVAAKSFRNLPQVHLLEPGELNAYDILVSDFVVFTRDALPSSSGSDGATGTAKATRTPAAAKPAATKKATPAAKKATPAAKKSAGATEATAASQAETTEGSESGEDSDMASDLPNRPKSSGEAAKPVDPSERVKPAGEKTDPRFEAARLKSEKEAEVRAAKEQADASRADQPDEVAAEAPDDAGESKPEGGFSFNQTIQPDGDDS